VAHPLIFDRDALRFTHVEGVERVDDSTYLVLTTCPKPEAKTLVFQLIDDGHELRITNAENS
jgi:hypothetical protein